MLCFSFESLDTSFPVLVRSKFELFALSVPGLQDALELSAVGDQSTVFDTTRSYSHGLSC